VSNETPLRLGEVPLRNAPEVVLDNGRACIPQHYLQFQHNHESLEALLVDIDYSARYPIFACEDEGGLYLQVGIIGFDNYAKQSASPIPAKIVYGRKWRVELELPTSEIIQTAFLALKKAREHEIRELFRLIEADGHGYSTPFNNHHDLPLMAQNAELLTPASTSKNETLGSKEISQALEHLRYDSASFHLKNLQAHGDEKHIVDISIQSGCNTSLPELQSQTITLVLASLDINELYYELMNAMINLSDQHLDENFTYRHYRRFSRRYSIAALGELSKHVRRRSWSWPNSDFEAQFTDANYQTDLSRVPRLGEGLNARKIRSQLAYFDIPEGILPNPAD